MKFYIHIVHGALCAICLLPGSLRAQSASWQQPSNSSIKAKSKGEQVELTTPRPATGTGFQGATPVDSVVVPPNYQLAPGDQLDIRVFREPDLSTTARIANDGTIMVPLVGQLQVGGLSLTQTARLIQSKLAAGYLPNPQVSVNVTEFNHRRFTVLGQVTRSGTFDFPDEKPLDLLEAIGLAGGYTSIADPANVTIKRTVNGKTTAYHVNAKKMAQAKATYDVQVQPGDVIMVGESIF
jgi:protein involved in polysaccharide export with SLBB domain